MDSWLGTAEVGYGFPFGACSFTSRPCRYFTILREPISRLISAYNYFCLDCKDRHKFCATQQGRPAKNDRPAWVRKCMLSTCPNMSFLDWAKLHANLYTRLFSQNWARNWVSDTLAGKKKRKKRLLPCVLQCLSRDAPAHATGLRVCDHGALRLKHAGP